MTGAPVDPAALASRAGLPDALRVLLERHPRPSWDAHPEFDALTRFWLDRHLAFRELHGLLIAESQAVLDRDVDPRRAATQIARLGGAFLGDLHGHHQIEDLHYFPALRAQDPRLEAGFDLLDADHHALHEGLATLADAMNAALRGLTDAPADLDSLGRDARRDHALRPPARPPPHRRRRTYRAGDPRVPRRGPAMRRRSC